MKTPPAVVDALRAVCLDLAIDMVRDGEGATKVLTADVGGAATREQARAVARAIVDSNLVRTALHGGDPNWGRIIAAAGSAGAGIVDGRWSLSINGELWVDRNTVEVLSEERAHELIAVKDVGNPTRSRPWGRRGKGLGLRLEPGLCRHQRTLPDVSNLRRNTIGAEV